MGATITIQDEFIDHNIVRDTLIKQGAKVGNRFFDWFDYRCNRLNIHSKYKPIISNKVLMKLEYWKSDGFRGDDGNCGYSIPSTDNLMEVPSFYGENVGMNGWEYINPVTYKDNCLRIGDFRGYTVHEYPLTQSFYCPEKASREIGKKVACFCMSNTESEESLSIRDVEAIKDCYFGVYAVNVSDNSRTKVAFSAEMGSTSVELETGGMASYNTSDERLKENIRTFNAGETLMSLGGAYQFEYCESEVAENKRYEGTHIGLIYQKVKESALKGMCMERKDGYGALNYLDTDFISLLAAVEMEHEQKVKGLEEKVERLERMVEQLMNK